MVGDETRVDLVALDDFEIEGSSRPSLAARKAKSASTSTTSHCTLPLSTMALSLP
jgi:hypothetical protein